MKITPKLFEAYLKCPTKCWRCATVEPAAGNAYAEWLQSQNESYRAAAVSRLMTDRPADECAVDPPANTLKTAKWQFATDATVASELRSSRGNEAQTSPPPASTGNSKPNDQSLLTSAATIIESRLHAVERVPSEGRGKAAQFVPIRFIFRNKLTPVDKVLEAFDAFVLSEVLGREVTLGKIIHGDDHATFKVKTSALAGEVRKCLEKIAALLSNPAPPDLVLNRHCAECEFQARCRKIAVEKDDLSLLAGMSAKERQKLRSKGIFTAQGTGDSGEENPHRRQPGTEDRRHARLSGCRGPARPRFLLPHRRAHRPRRIRRPAQPVGGHRRGRGEDLAGIPCHPRNRREAGANHYGSYETTFSKQMAERHGSPKAESVAAKAIASALNLVSVMFAKIYFPTYSNSLKEIARHLTFEWSEVDASGAGSIAWRQNWEKSHSALLMQRLITYNTEDCMALARLNGHLGDLAANDGKANGSADVVHADSLSRNFPCTFKVNKFQFAEFDQINQAAYWDYQREKILVKSSERLKRIARTATTKKRLQPRINKTVEWPGPKTCPNCGALKINKHQAAGKTVIDVRFGSASVRKWVTKYRFHRYRCPACRAVFHNSESAWGGEKFGPNLRSFCVFQNIELRLPQSQAAAFLNLVLGFHLSSKTVNKFKEIAAGFYQATHEAMLRNRSSAGLWFTRMKPK